MASEMLVGLVLCAFCGRAATETAEGFFDAILLLRQAVERRQLFFGGHFDVPVIDANVAQPAVRAANSVQSTSHFPLPASFDAVRLRC
jgi:hypothetical protein